MQIRSERNGVHFTPPGGDGAVVVKTHWMISLSNLFGSTLHLETEDGTTFCLNRAQFLNRVVTLLPGDQPRLTDLFSTHFTPAEAYQKLQDAFHNTPWTRMRARLEDLPTTIGMIARKEIFETTRVLEQHQADLENVGYWDEERQVRHIRPSDVPEWKLPRAIEMWQGHIYVLNKGRRSAKLGTGGFKEVVEVFDLTTGKREVQATVRLDRAEEQGYEEVDIRGQTYRELDFLRRFQGNPRFVQWHYVTHYAEKKHPDRRKIGIMMEHCNGGDLFDAVRDRMRQEDLLSIVEDMVRILVDLENEGILHLDMKLENLFVVCPEEGEGPLHVKIGDFGLSNTCDAEYARRQRVPMATGTKFYVAPEAVWNTGTEDRDLKEKSSPKLDVWGMGVVLYSFLTSRCPTFGEGATAGTNCFTEDDLAKGFNKLWSNPYLMPYAVRGNTPREVTLREGLLNLCWEMLTINQAQRPLGSELLPKLLELKEKWQGFGE